MKVLVTGGGGFLGGRISRLLRDRGDEVTVLGRGEYPHLSSDGVRVIRGDIRDRSAVEKALRNQDAVIHAAALAGIWGRPDDFREINFAGTQNVVAACRASGVPRLVYTSSPSVIFGGDELRGVDESQPYPARYTAAYPQTKAAAERHVLASNGANLATVALRPHLIWGPGDPHLIPRVLDRARRGRLVQVGDGTNLVDITYIDNAAEAHVQALDRLAPGAPCAGRAYFISQGEPAALWPWLNEILAGVGLPPVSRRVSFRAAFRAGAAFEAAYRLLRLGGEPPMTRFLATQLAKSHYFDINAARRDLGYHPRISTGRGLEALLAALRKGESALK